MSILSQHNPEVCWTVGELNAAAREILLNGMPPVIWLQGELGRISISGAQHVYAPLKDPQGNSIDLVYFRGAQQVRAAAVTEGAIVMVCGSLDLYAQSGRYQFRVTQLVPQNRQGDLMQRYEELKRRLHAEGLFDPSRKKPLPLIPACIGVCTSARQGAAALKDFLLTLDRRFPNLHVRIVSVQMQGDAAAAQVASAVQFLNQQRACDVIVITRGGGSMEDLWAFNDEALARTVAASDIPVVSAIGHGIDCTILDFVADRSVITPTDAAVVVTEAAVQIQDRLATLGGRLLASIRNRLLATRNRLLRAQSCPYLQRPEDLYLRQAQRLDRATQRLAELLPHRAAEARQRLQALQQRLQPALLARLAAARAALENARRPLLTLDPKGVLKRGYSILLDDSRRAVRAPADTTPGQPLTALVAEGEIHVTVSAQ